MRRQRQQRAENEGDRDRNADVGEGRAQVRELAGGSEKRECCLRHVGGRGQDIGRHPAGGHTPCERERGGERQCE